MMKKGFSLAMICLALLLYMLHAAVPHHHHQEAICFHLHCLEHCDGEHHHDGACHHHSPDECQIFSSLAVTVNDDKQQEISSSIENDTDHQYHVNISIIPSTDFAISPIFTHFFHYVVRDELLWRFLQKIPNGLRAPPVA